MAAEWEFIAFASLSQQGLNRIKPAYNLSRLDGQLH